MQSSYHSGAVRPVKVVAMGGGTGLSTLLHGLKQHVILPGEEPFDRALPFISELSAIVTVSDDGGSSGRLRKELNVPPPGDIRNCIVALSEKEALLSRLFQYRFKAGEGLEGHSFGNLFLSAMTDITGDFSEAVKHAAAILATRGHIYPATTSNAQLYAIMDDGSVVRGETNITASQRRIVELRMAPVNAKPAPAALEAIETADLITIGPGSLFTSLVPNLLVRDLVEGDQEFAGDQGLRLQPDDAGEREPGPDGIAAHSRASTSTPGMSSSTMRWSTRPRRRRRWSRSTPRSSSRRSWWMPTHIEALGVKPILGDYLTEEMDPNEGLIARHETHHVAHDLLRLMLEARETPGRAAAQRES